MYMHCPPQAAVMTETNVELLKQFVVSVYAAGSR